MKMQYKQWSALFFACEGKHDGIEKLLLEYGADVNLKDSVSILF